MTLATSRHMLVRIGFSASASNDIYRRQGIDLIDEWENFDKDDIVLLLHSVRKPGGSGNGKMVGFKVELNLQLAVFFVHHKIRTIRTMYYRDITVLVIPSLKNNAR